MPNEPGVAREGYLSQVPFKDDRDYHIAPKYDSVSEGEATARPVEQTIAGVVSARLGEARALMADLPRVYDEEWADSDDLLTGAPKGGDRPDDPVHPDQD
jgi:hypothetical protein